MTGTLTWGQTIKGLLIGGPVLAAMFYFTESLDRSERRDIDRAYVQRVLEPCGDAIRLGDYDEFENLSCRDKLDDLADVPLNWR